MSSRDLAVLRRADAEARLRAQTEFERPLVLEAGAGTGKTASLVARVLAWCLGPGWDLATRRRLDAADAPAVAEERIAADLLSRVVAITFTEAAAAEMADRVGDGLREIVAGGLPTGLDERALQVAGEARRERARALVAALDHLVVRTIHAWCRSLLARHPLESGLHPRFEVDADGERQARVVREVLEEQLRATNEVDGFPPLLELIAAGHELASIEEGLTFLLGAGARSADFEDDPFSPQRFAAAAADLEACVRTLLEAEDGALAPFDKRTLSTREALLKTAALFAADRAADTAADREVERDPVETLVAGLVESWERLDRERLEKWGKGELSQGEAKALAERAPDFVAACRRLHHRLAVWWALDPAKTALAREVVGDALREVEARLRSAGIVGFSALLSSARDLLRRHRFVRERLRREIDQLLVDEFQDTDRLQCELVEMLALVGDAKQRPGLFLVGDPKQSIYAWRGADLAAYDGFLDRVRSEGGECLRLSVSFRSVPAILDEVDRVIEPVMCGEPGLQPSFEPLVPVADNPNAEGFAHVEHWVSWKRDEDGVPENPTKATSALESAELEARALARDLRRHHEEEGVPWQEMGVLFRSGNDMETYLHALRDAGVPYAVERDRSYYRRRAVVEAIAAIRVILDPHDRLALLTFLRGAAVGVPDAALLPLWRRGLPARVATLHGDASAQLAALEALVRDAAAEVPAGLPGVERVAGWEAPLLVALEHVARLRESFERDAPDRFVEALRARLSLEAGEASRHLGAFQAANLDRLFRNLRTRLVEDADVRHLLRRLRMDVALQREAEEERPKAGVDDAVSVMTIHKSKGLDFRHVYLVQLHKQSGARNQPPPVALSRDGECLDYRLFGVPTPGLAAQAERRVRTERAEAVRVLYVAMTRAKQRLVMLGQWDAAPEPKDADAAGTLLHLLHARDGLPEDLPSWMQASVAEPDREHRDRWGARWRFPACEPREASRGGAADALACELPTPERVAADAAQLSLAREAAAREAARRFRGVATEEARALVFEAENDAAELASTGDAAVAASEEEVVEVRVARAAGTLAHRILEEIDLSTSPRDALETERAQLQGRVAACVSERDRADVEARVAEILERMAGGEVMARLERVASGVVARELALLQPPSPGGAGDASGAGASGFVVGAIDLVYRDPEDGRWVVVDYKTDRTASDAALAERAAHHRAQGQLYVRALQEALALSSPPRFELWFLWADRVVEVPLEAS